MKKKKLSPVSIIENRQKLYIFFPTNYGQAIISTISSELDNDSKQIVIFGIGYFNFTHLTYFKVKVLT